MRIFLLTILTFLFKTAISQTNNSYLFIEPNVSLSYDSTKIKIKDRFSNTYYHTESYSFIYISSNAHLLIDAGQSNVIPTKKYQDSLIDLSIRMCNKLDNDTIQVYKDGISINYRGFSGFGFIAKSKKEKKYAISFYCTKYYDGGHCSIVYTMTTTNKIDGYDNDRNILSSIIDGITTYTKKDFEFEDSLLLTKYSITVDSIGRPSDFPAYSNRTFFGKVTIKPSLENIVKEVSVSTRYGSQIFTPNANGQIIIDCNDKQKGEIEKKCELILLNRYGKQVRVPFIFKYVNYE